MEKHYAVGTHKPKRRPRKALMLIWREQMGFTQRDAVKALGCSKGALIGWELGRHELPRYIGLAMQACAMDMQPFGAKPLPANGEE
jgi:transcriptional regulator with XRE-family HTH domain